MVEEATSDAALVERFPNALIDDDTKEHYRGWLDRKLVLSRCAQCRTWHHPPKSLCPECWSSGIEPSVVSGRGVVHLLVLMHQGPPAPGVDYSGPHPAVTVELEEQPGLRYTSALVNWSPGDLAIGLPVELTWTERHGAPFPVFQPRERGRSA